MSHVVTVKSELRDASAIAAACHRLKLQAPVQGTAKLYSGEASGLLVQLPHWEYPVVIDTRDGSVRFDNFEGRWGDPQNLDRFLQAYSVEKARLEARRRGHQVHEHTLSDGSIQLNITEGY